MDGWMDGWMDGRTDGWIDGWMDGWADGRMDGWMDGRMDGWTDGWMDRWMDGQMDGWMDGQMEMVNASMHERIHVEYNQCRVKGITVRFKMKPLELMNMTYFISTPLVDVFYNRGLFICEVRNRTKQWTLYADHIALNSWNEVFGYLH